MQNVVHEQYTENKEYRFQVIQRKEHLFQIVLEKRYSDWLWEDEIPSYEKVHHGIHFADTLQKAIDIGKEELACFSDT